MSVENIHLTSPPLRYWQPCQSLKQTQSNNMQHIYAGERKERDRTCRMPYSRPQCAFALCSNSNPWLVWNRQAAASTAFVHVLLFLRVMAVPIRIPSLVTQTVQLQYCAVDSYLPDDLGT